MKASAIIVAGALEKDFELSGYGSHGNIQLKVA